ncbi:MAG: hypothetical protein QOJ51_3656 [Acidobacteriaceae bacterium]|jgi:hypothetical protein|nr:hypothetical protein [Acidobacteriaceae bacterium]MEA2260831.1 hypothetical protein [Acidobacteriaceae bacterium]
MEPIFRRSDAILNFKSESLQELVRIERADRVYMEEGRLPHSSLAASQLDLWGGQFRLSQTSNPVDRAKKSLLHRLIYQYRGVLIAQRLRRDIKTIEFRHKERSA